VLRKKSFFPPKCSLGEVPKPIHGLKQDGDYFLRKSHSLAAAEIK
jgi:hypothetical protein